MKTGPQLTLLLVVMALAPMAIQQVILQDQSREALRESIAEKEVATASALGERTTAFIEQLTAEIRAGGHTPAFLYGGGDAGAQSDILNLLVARSPALLSVASVDLAGQEIARGSALRSFEALDNHAGDASLRRALDGDRVIEAPTLDPATREVRLRMWVPIELFPGEVRAVLVSTVRMQNLLESITDYEPPGGGYAFVLGPDGRPIAHPNRMAIVSQATLIEPEIPLTTDGTIVWEHPDLGEVLVVHHAIPVTGWSVVVVRPTGEVFSRLGDVTRLGTTIALATGAVVVVASFGFARTLTRPLRTLDQAAARLAAGDLRTPIKTDATNEVGNFARTFEAMRRQLHDLYVGLEEKVAQRTRQLESARADVAGLNDLLTHDIGNYVTPSREHLSTLVRSTDLNPKDRRRAETALRGVDRISELVENVRLLSQLEAGDDEALRSHMRVENVHDILQEAAARARDAYAGVDGLDLRLGTAFPRAAVDASPLLLDVFLNILTNAIKYSERPVVDIEVERTQAATGPAWRILVKDRGLGIPDEMKETIFERFRRLHKPIRGHSTGLGLTIARRVVASHGGTLHVEDRVVGEHAQGAVFVVTLPARSPSEDAAR